MSDSTALKGFPRVHGIAVGQEVEACIGGNWVPATLTWIGEIVVFVATADGAKHRVDRFASSLRVPAGAEGGAA